MIVCASQRDAHADCVHWQGFSWIGIHRRNADSAIFAD
jgi:hypothetical protein